MQKRKERNTQDDQTIMFIYVCKVIGHVKMAYRRRNIMLDAHLVVEILQH